MERLLSTLVIAMALSFHCIAQTSDPAKSIMVIIAHPDDELLILPLAAKYQREGINVRLVIATDGQKGVVPHFKVPEGKSLATIRRQEALCAAEVLGLLPPLFLEMEDGSLAEFGNLSILKDKIKKVIADERPDLMITWGPEGGYGHPDHRMVHAVVSEIYQEGCEGCSPLLLFPGFPSELDLPLENLTTFGAKFIAGNLHRVQTKYFTHQIEYSSTDLDLARKSFACHQSQFDGKTADEIFLLMSLAGNKVYLRSFHSGVAGSESLFH